MKRSSIDSLVTGLLLACFVGPLRGDPRRGYWTSYSLYDPEDPRLRAAEVFPDRHGAQPVQRLPLYATLYESKPFPAHANIYPERVPIEIPHGERYRDHQDFVVNDRRRMESDDRANFERAGNAETDSKEQEIARNMNILDKLLSEDSSEKDFGANAIEDDIISEETKRVAREIRKKKPGFFWTLARITFETINDTKSAIQQIGDMVNESIVPDSATQSSMTSGSLVAVNVTTATGNATAGNETQTTTTTTSPTTTTVGGVGLTRSGLQSLIRRNVLGLVRLFNIEWKDALNESEVTVKEFRKDLGNQVGSYLRDNPNAY